VTVWDKIQAGNAFVRRVVVVFVLVHYLILPRPSAVQQRLNGVVAGTLQVLEAQKRRAQLDIGALNLRCGRILPHIQPAAGPATVQLSPRLDVSTPTLVGVTGDGRSEPKCEEATSLLRSWDSGLRPIPARVNVALRRLRPVVAEWRTRQGELVAIDKEWLAMSRSRVDRQLRVPGVDVSVDEADVRKFYALLLGLALVTLAYYRHRVLSALHREPTLRAEVPFWAAPTPYEWSTTGDWLRLNILGLSMVGVAFAMLFAFSARDEFYLVEGFTGMSALLTVALLAYYAVALWRIATEKELQTVRGANPVYE
jgi:hypothetical protein